MVEKIKGISIQGRCFEGLTDLIFYPNENDRISIIYGKNGSGKSTISEGFRELTSQNGTSDITVSFLHDDQKALTDKNIYVFNECYIDKNVKIEEDGLGTIVLLGGRVDLEEEINKYLKEKQKVGNDLELLIEGFEKYNNTKNPLCPLFHMERIKKVLRESGGWAESDSKIRGNRKNSSVTDTIIKEICSMSTELSKSELKVQFKQIEKLLNKIQTTEKYSDKVKLIDYSSVAEKSVCEILAKSIDRPVLTEREKMIISAIEQGHQGSIETARKEFLNPQVKHCSYCYQRVTEEYKRDLVLSIDQVLNKDVEKHKNELERIVFPKFDVDYMQYASLDSELVNKIIAQVNLCKDIVRQYNDYIIEKSSNIYTVINIKGLGLNENINLLNKTLNQLEENRVKFNEISSKSETIKEELIEINKLIAHQQISQSYADYTKQLIEQNQHKNNISAKKQELLKIKNNILSLEAEKTNIGLAIGAINNALDYVFFTKGRLSIELRNNKYYLKSNGQDVRPKNISLGERNIIALCYFFTQIMENQEVERAYKDEKMVIIDDPISSFDFENKVGIMSFLRYQINRIIKANEQSKILILSHDLVTVFDLRKAVEEICSATKENAKVSNTTYSIFELVDRGLNGFSKRRSEYSELLQNIYEYANSSENEESITIGNTMRRALEAFSTFNYKKSIQDVSCDANVLKTLGNHSSYFENLMYRLVLHNESHYEEQIYNLHDNANFYNYISENEKKRTAKDVLCFMFFINPDHIKAHLKSVKNAIRKIEEWGKCIPNNASFKIQEKQLEKDDMRSIKLFDLPLSAGLGNFVLENELPYVEFKTDNKDCDFALQIRGNSMEPAIKDGNIVLVKQCHVVEEGQMGAFYYNGEVYCKTINYRKDKIYMVSLNSEYSDIEISESDSFKVYGKIVEVEDK